MDLHNIALVLPAVIIGLTVHEFAHAYMAYKLGDHTAKDQGRLTLNPLKHIDWLGFAFIVFAGFGWAKPVVFNPDNLKKKHRDEILIGIAGPLSNLLLSIIFFLNIKVIFLLGWSNSFVGAKAVDILYVWGFLNIGLFVFNMIPIPPLDGSHFYQSYLSKTNPQLMYNLYRYGTLGLFVIILIGNFLDVDILHISQLIQFVSGFILNLIF